MTDLPDTPPEVDLTDEGLTELADTMPTAPPDDPDTYQQVLAPGLDITTDGTNPLPDSGQAGPR